MSTLNVYGVGCYRWEWRWPTFALDSKPMNVEKCLITFLKSGGVPTEE